MSVCSPTPPGSVKRSSPSKIFWMQDDRESDLEAFDIARAARNGRAQRANGFLRRIGGIPARISTPELL